MLGHSSTGNVALGESTNRQYYTLSVVSSAVASVSRLISLIRSATSATTVFAVKSIRFIRSASSTATASFSRQIQLVKLAVSTAVASIAFIVKPFVVLGVLAKILDDPRVIKIKRRR